MFSLDFITAIVCIFCLALAAVSYHYFSKRIKELKQLVKTADGDVSKFEKSKIKSIASDYMVTMDENGKTVEYASDYFNLNALANVSGIHLKVFSAMPSVLTSIGIMGTFLGLSRALQLFNSDTTAAIKDSINVLLAGMGTAFYTSLVGMICSAVFLLLERRLLSQAEADINEFCGKADMKNHISSEDAMLSAFIQKDEDDFDVLPGEALAKIGRDMSLMKTAIETFGTDLYDSLGNALDKSFEEKLVPILNDLSQKLENPAQAVIDGLVTELKRVCKELEDNLTRGINTQMNELLSRFITASDAINNIPDVLSEVSGNILSSSEDTIKANKEIASTLDAQVERMKELSNVFAQEVADATKEISKMLDEQVIRLSDLSDSFADNIERATESAEKLTGINDSLANVPETINAASESIITATSSLDGASSNIKSSSKALGDALDYVKQSNDSTGLTVQKYTEEIETLQKGLKVIFAQIQEGLNRYAAATRDGLQTMLDPFSTTLTDATTKVTNSIAPLNDAVTDLGNFGIIVKNSLRELSDALKPLEEAVKQLKKNNNN